MKILGYILVSLFAILLIGVFTIGVIAPETSVYLGHQVPKKYKKEIQSLELLDSDETIKYFYTDGFLDIKDGLYFVTDKNLVVYCQVWDEPATIISFDEITKLDVEYDNSFVNDSYINIETIDGLEISFPVSSEKKRDKLFYEYLLEKSEINLDY